VLSDAAIALRQRVMRGEDKEDEAAAQAASTEKHPDHGRDQACNSDRGHRHEATLNGIHWHSVGRWLAGCHSTNSARIPITMSRTALPKASPSNTTSSGVRTFALIECILRFYIDGLFLLSGQRSGRRLVS
jgi:hypothetical protein